MQTQSSGGVGLFTLMFILFLGLKLGGIIAWSWWWVTAPLWGPLVFIVSIVILCAIFLK